MNQYSFSVLTEPWVPVITPQGDLREQGLLECLEHAHELKGIRAPSPIVEFGLYRLLTAFVLDALINADRRPENPLDLKALLLEGRFDMDMIRKYVGLCGDVFDLFHPERPFLQTKMEDEPLKALAGMFPAVPSGTNANLWHHGHEDEFSVSSADAARLLTSIAPFMTAGGSGLGRSINLDPPLYVLVIGRNLFKTIVQNLPLRKQGNKDGPIAWRNFSPAGKERPQVSTTEGLTWRARKIQLVPEKNKAGEIFVKAMKFSPGDKTKAGWVDPNVAYSYEKEKIKAVLLKENRSIWRDAGPLLLMSEKKYGNADKKEVFRRPDVIENIFEILDEKSDLVVVAYGMRVDYAKVYEWVRSSLTLPYQLGYSTRLGFLLINQLNCAEDVASALQFSLKTLYPREGKETKEQDRAQKKKKSKKQKFLGTLRNRAERSFWEKLEPFFYKLMRNIGDLKPEAVENADVVAIASNEWRKNIRLFALEQFEMSAKDMDADSNALARLVNSRSRLRKKISGIIGEVV